MLINVKVVGANSVVETVLNNFLTFVVEMVTDTESTLVRILVVGTISVIVRIDKEETVVVTFFRFLTVDTLTSVLYSVIVLGRRVFLVTLVIVESNTTVED